MFLTILMQAKDLWLYCKDRKQVLLHIVILILTNFPWLFQALSYISFNKIFFSNHMIKKTPILVVFLQEILTLDTYKKTVALTNH